MKKDMTVVRDRERHDNPAQSRPLRWVEIVQGSMVGVLIILLVSAASLVYRESGAAAGHDTTPDAIIIIVADALRADRLSCYGYAGIQTPHIDSLARDGVVYHHTYTQDAWTKSSVATMLSSLYPPTHQALCFDDTLPDEVLTLPEILSLRGYHTVGFVANTNLFPQFNFQQGYSEYYALDGNRSTQFIGGEKYYQEAKLVNEQVLAWLETEHGKPGHMRFFMYIHYMDPHRPYFVHPYDEEKQDDNREEPGRTTILSDLYDGEIAYLDMYLGDLFAALKQLGLYDDALIVFTSDHGEEFYEHQGWRHGKTLYEEIMHVPLIVKYPGRVGAGTVDEGLARTLDIAPTILDVAGIEPPATMEGVSLRMPPDSPARAQFIFAETFCMAGVMAVRTPRFKLVEVIDGDLRSRAPTQLYDLEADPGETTNLAVTQPDLVAWLREDMSRTVFMAERLAMGGHKTDLDPEFLEHLYQLGY